MTTTTTTSSARNRWAWLALGAVLLALAHTRWNVGLLAWVAPIPLLRYLRLTRGPGSRAAFAIALATGWIAATLKIVSAPLPLAFGLLGVGFALVQLVGYLVADGLRRRTSRPWSVLAFPAAITVAEWVQHRFTPLASWGAAAYTQLGDLPLLQVASVLGMAAVSFLVYAAAAAGEELLSHRLDGAPAGRAPLREAVAVVAAVALAHVYGVARLAEPVASSVKVAAVGTTATFGATGLPDVAERTAILDQLFADTALAARSGARLVVWTEAAALAWPEEEQALIARATATARELGVHLVVAYIVPGRVQPFLDFENKYAWLRPDGAVDHTYFKHHPAPGEASLVGVEPIVAVETPFGRASGAICYDYDFPAIARAHGALDVDLVAVPSSDWRGIDPIHTEMATLRAIEQGVSIVRSTRFGLSAGIDPFGRVRAAQSSFEIDGRAAPGDRVLVTALPRRGVATLYRTIGDAFVFLCMAVLGGLTAALLRSARGSSAHDLSSRAPA